ncbi:WD40/YVTN/BNR-like repeat-containing protein [Parasphingorhabdus halotolerans]|uniref:Photosynthesis system II assembly factor Ycf48/Hcf136-like domain-containing protein n=1 Tax=Parasphingorhabdus halotolerans TaxID=2725558 RepID=A0A6H2DML2_9SPHN|nr:YCF48-related protein [Parasphingorhabdus halotolerans]QJB69912.1 hypothetical protein HF685_11965 [Parasphingorhabdus halotolerans]
MKIVKLAKRLGCCVLLVTPGLLLESQLIQAQPHPISAAEAVNSWQTLDTEAYKGKRDDISFGTPTHGWYGTGKGDLFATEDGGENWKLVSSRPGTFIRALGFIDEKTGFIGNVGTDYYPGVTDETPLYRTDDGGMNWTPVDLGNNTIKGVCAIDILPVRNFYQGELRDETIIHAAGRVGGPTGILRSLDGGHSWTVIDMQDHAGMILDIKFFDAWTGLVFASSSTGDDRQGLILRTTDGGKSWKQVYRSGRDAELIWKASFVDSKTGYATVQSYDAGRAQQLIVKTSDGGKSWSELPLTSDTGARQFGIGFVDENHGWVGTMAGGFYTSDGGKSFTPAPIARAANKFRIIRGEKDISVFAIGTEVQRLKLEASGQRNKRNGRE